MIIFEKEIGKNLDKKSLQINNDIMETIDQKFIEHKKLLNSQQKTLKNQLIQANKEYLKAQTVKLNKQKAQLQSTVDDKLVELESQLESDTE